VNMDTTANGHYDLSTPLQIEEQGVEVTVLTSEGV